MEENTKQSNNKKIIILRLTLIAVFILALLTMYVYIATDFFKTPEQLFEKYLISGLKEFTQFNTEPYAEVFERIKKEPTQITTKTNFNYTFKTNDLFSSKKDKRQISSTGILKTNSQDNISELIIDVKNNEKDFFKLNLLETENSYGIYIPGLHEKYISIENRDFKNIAQNLGASKQLIESIPDKINKTSDIDLLEDKKLKTLISKYINQSFEQINTTSYTEENYTLSNFFGERLKGKKYVLTISDMQFYNFALNLYKNLIQDEYIFQIIEKYIPEESLEKLKQFARTENFKELDSKGNVIISIFESDGKTVKIQLEILQEKKIEINLLNKINSSNFTAEYSVLRTEDNPVAYKYVVDLSNKQDNNQSLLTLQGNLTYDQNDISELRTKSYSSAFYSIFFGEKNTENYDLQNYENKSVTYKLTSTTTENEVQAKLTFEGIKLKKELSDLDISFNIEFDNNLKISKLDDKQQILINDYTKKDFESLKEKISANIIKEFENNPDSLIGSFLGPIVTITSNLSQNVEYENQIDFEDNNNDNTNINSSNTVDNDTISNTQSDESLLKQSLIIGRDLAQEIFDNAASQINPNFTPTEQEITRFNRKFDAFAGNTITGSNVKSLLNTITANHSLFNSETHENYSLTIIADNQTIIYTDDFQIFLNNISELRKQIQNRNYYNVEMFYDELGFINKISITKSNE